MTTEEFDNALMAATNLYAETFGCSNLITVRRISHFEKAFLNFYNSPVSAIEFLEEVKSEIEMKDKNVLSPAVENDMDFLTKPVMLHTLDDNYHITNSVRMINSVEALTAGFFTCTNKLPKDFSFTYFIIPWFIGIGYKKMIICLQ